MGRPYSFDLRERVVQSVAAGMSCRAAAGLYNIGVSTAIRWAKRQQEKGIPAALPMGGKRAFCLAGERDWLLARMAEKPDTTLRALLTELEARGVAVSYFAVWHFVHRAGLSFKKSLHASEQERPDVARRRARWKQYQHKIDGRRLVFVDETWTKTNMTRTGGWYAEGEHLVGRVPHGHRHTMTFVAALRCDGVYAPCVLDQPINGASFLAWVVQFLVPTLRRGDIVVMDNL